MTATLEQARAAYSQRDFGRARQLFTDARLDGALGPDDLYSLSDAAWWVGDNATVTAAAEEAYRLYCEEDRPLRAGYVALDIAVAYFLRGEDTLGSGWLARARRLLDEQPEAAEHGYLLYLVGVEGPLGGIVPSEPAAIDALLTSARAVQEIGRRHGDATLVAAGMLGEGRGLVKAGRVAEGLSLLDEAMVAVLSDELNPAWAGNIYCHLMSAAEELGDVRRARDWMAATTQWLAGIPVAVVFTGICRVHRARVQQLSGEWEGALREASRVCQDLEELDSGTAAAAHYQIGEIRRLRGDRSGAEAAYERAHALGHDPQPGLALLRLAEGRTDVALRSIQAALLAERAPLSRAPLCAAHVDIALASGRIEDAVTAAEELRSTAAAWNSSGLAMAAHHARGAILLAEGRAADALHVLRQACRGWSEVEAPWNCARVRVLLAAAYRMLGDEDAAVRELDVAAEVFERLGAGPDMRAVDRLRRARSLPGGLTPREAQVLELVAAGLTNRSIATQLVVSEKTVARHLSNIFAKLGVSSRTAAASFAHEHGLAAPRDA
jgi:DNA-binding CsgD family transcriptional regulator